MTSQGFGIDQDGLALAYAATGIVEWGSADPDGWRSGRLSPDEARARTDALHASVHAAADAAETGGE
ncbi:hypothetical protein [Rhodococcus sp. 14-2470-1a]|uniref:hypothetical protein n=1 Tax=Rhodococcus sp. 14-2470-1a TaxID=2023150 RepID=UPI000B9A7A33|nr:hypothetical protein [Rhodococcus sp. 14-2470-1a]OZF47597.1 hypothetical protein CH292_19440 [Rhodococcus sp. 14-2470-1a]